MAQYNNGVEVVEAHAALHQDGGTDEVSIAALSGEAADDQPVIDAQVTAVAVARTILDANSILGAVSDNTPIAIALAASQVLGRKATGNIAAMTAAEVRTILGVETGATADLTGTEIVALLEALGGGSQLSHDQLDDVSAVDHHSNTLDHSDAADHSNAQDHSNASDHAEVHSHVTTVIKSSDQVVNDSDTLVNDSEILWAVGANETWVFQIILRYDTTAAARMLVGLALPSGAVFMAALDSGSGFDTVRGPQSLFVGNPRSLEGFGIESITTTDGSVITGGTSGNVVLQFTQSIAEVSDTKMKANTTLVARKVS